MAKKKRKIPSRSGGNRGGKRNMMPKGNPEMKRQLSQLQDQLDNIQAELESAEYEASAGGGMVTATVNGALALVSISIDPEAVDEDDVETLEDLVLSAVKGAQNKANEAEAASRSSLADGLGINLPI